MIKKLIGCGLVLGSLVSCGGGGGGGDNNNGGNEPAFLAGVYSGSVTLDSNNCGVSITTQEPYRWTVNQDGDSIVLDSAKGETFTGSVLDDSSFAVKKDTISGQCTGHTTVTVSSISDNAAKSRVEISLLCGNRSCTLLYTGSAARRTN